MKHGHCTADSLLLFKRKPWESPIPLQDIPQRFLEKAAKLRDANNNERQNGKMLDGLSPREAFCQYLQSPPIQLDESTRYLLATNRRELTVTQNGVTIRIGKNKFLYRSEATGALAGQKVLAWFNIENPEIITLTSLDQKNPVTVKRSTDVPAYQANRDIIAQAKRECFAHSSYAKTLHSKLKKVFPEEFGNRNARPVITDAETRKLGQTMRDQHETMKAEADREKSLHNRLRRMERERGLVSVKATRNVERKLLGLQLVEEAERGGNRTQHRGGIMTNTRRASGGPPRQERFASSAALSPSVVRQSTTRKIAP